MKISSQRKRFEHFVEAEEKLFRHYVVYRFLAGLKTIPILIESSLRIKQFTGG